MSKQFDCPSCGWKGHPTFDLNGKGKLVAKCQGQGCDYVDVSLSPADFNTGLAVPADAPRGSMAAAQPVETKAAPVNPPVRDLVSPARVPLPTTPPSPLPSAPPADVIGMIKARRDWLEAEVAKADGYRVELRKLTKMLSAAGQLSGAPTKEPN